MVLGLLVHVTPSNFFRRILRNEALVYKSYFFQSEQPFYGNYSTSDSHTITDSNFSGVCLLVKMALKTVTRCIQKSAFYSNLTVSFLACSRKIHQKGQ